MALAIGVVLAITFRKSMWPWRLKCRKCGKKMDWDAILGRDANLCQECWEEEHPEEKEKREEKERKASISAQNQEKIDELCVKADKVDDIPWGSWEPTERCVLTYVMDSEKALLILKKRGMGEGYFNAPGGHIELEETSVEAAVRMIGYGFTTDQWEGELIDECDETKPFWVKKSDIDYSRMWEDDRLWLPMLMEGKKFEGWFIFDDRKMVDAKVEETVEEE